jgi:hypothetical protein
MTGVRAGFDAALSSARAFFFDFSGICSCGILSGAQPALELLYPRQPVIGAQDVLYVIPGFFIRYLVGFDGHHGILPVPSADLAGTGIISGDGQRDIALELIDKFFDIQGAEADVGRRVFEVGFRKSRIAELRGQLLGVKNWILL